MSSTTMQGTITEAPVGNTTRLLPVDRCDVGSCNSQAYVRVTLIAGGELLFCGHDYHERELGLATIAAHVHDQRADLLPKPYDPATDNS